MTMTKEEFLTTLLAQITVSGCEEDGAEVVARYMKDVADEIRRDDIGNTVCVLKPDCDCRVLLSAHIDEIGLLVTAVTANGRLLVTDRGGIVTGTYPGHQIIVHTEHGPVYGVVESNRGLFAKEGGLKTKDFLIDIGVDTKEEALKLVELGDTVVFDAGVKPMAGGRFSGRALDDRLGVFIIMEAMRRVKGQEQCGIYSAATVGEETTKNGAYWTTKRVKPSLAVVVDVTYATDCSGTTIADTGEVKLGGGPVLCNSPLVSKQLNRIMRECARDLNIPVQTEATDRLTHTDADKIHFSGEGVPTVLVSIPLRYMHNPAEVADERDVKGCIELIAEFLRRCRPETMEFRS